MSLRIISGRASTPEEAAAITRYNSAVGFAFLGVGIVVCTVLLLIYL